MPRVPPPGRRFGKGNQANAKGSSALARARAAARRAHKMLTPDELAQIMSTLFKGTPEEMAEIANEEGASVLVKLLAQFLTGCSRKPDIKVLSSLLAHTVGAPRERKQHEHTGPDGGPIRTTQAMTDEEVEAELAAIRARKL